MQMQLSVELMLRQNTVSIRIAICSDEFLEAISGLKYYRLQLTVEAVSSRLM